MQWEGDDRPPPNWRRLAEGAWLLPRILTILRRARTVGPDNGPPVLVIPGWAASDRTTRALREALAEAGWRVHGWKLGFNRGATSRTVDQLRRRLAEVGGGQPVLVVGWSLGGVYARELARAMPDQVRAVVTLGSPFSGDPRQNNVWRLYEWVAGHKVDEPPIPRVTDKPPVPQLALWSRRDGIVAPRAARGLEHERDKAVEMRCTHMAFGVSKTAARAVVGEIRLFLEELGRRPESQD